MNQILQTYLNNKKSNPRKSKNLLRFQLYCSIVIIILIISFIAYKSINLYKKEKYSKQLLNSYNITKIYSNLSSNYDKNTKNSNVIGIIDIPSINVNYPIFSEYTDELLKISPCKFHGPSPGEFGNLCIAGHNYDNEKFFSKISTLDINDEIIIYNYNNKYSYYVFDIYEVKHTDLSSIYLYDENSIQLTLVTCNNFNSNRIIVKALYKN